MVCLSRPPRPLLATRGACRRSSVTCTLRWSGQDHFGWRSGCAESVEHSGLTVDVADSMDVSAETRVTVELGEAAPEPSGSVVLQAAKSRIFDGHGRGFVGWHLTIGSSDHGAASSVSQGGRSMIWINQLRWTSVKPRVAQPHR